MHGGRPQDKGKALLLRELIVKLLLALRVAFGRADLICGRLLCGTLQHSTAFQVPASEWAMRVACLIMFYISSFPASFFLFPTSAMIKPS